MRFSSGDYAADEAFDAYRGLWGFGTQITAVGEVFSVEFTGIRFPSMLLWDRALQGVSHERSPRRIAADGIDHVVLQHVLEGRMLIVTDDVTRVAEVGETAIFDLTRPQWTRVDRARVVTVSIARDALAKARPLFVDLHGLVLPAAGSELLTDFIRSLIRHRHTIDQATAQIATDTVGALLQARLGQVGGDGAPLVRTAKLHQILAFIEANLFREDLNPTTIAKRTGVSRTALYKLFEPFGGVSARIQQRRLRALRRALARADDALPFNAIAESYGFADPVHAHKCFRKAFGETPGDFRRASREKLRLAGAVVAPSSDEFARWFTEVR